MATFRRKLLDRLDGEGSPDKEREGFDGLMDIVARLNVAYKTKRETQEAARDVLLSLFPTWLPPAFAALFSANIPALSCRMNALVTKLTCGWLMGSDMELYDVESTDWGEAGVGQGLLVKRCRFLEGAGCASVCVNTCKVPTQEFFDKYMGLPLYMEPNYDDFSCKFNFGVSPPPENEDPAFQVGCFSQCPSRGSLKLQAKQCSQIIVPDG
eukprot:CAMPEP_0113952842 /NCGR_PEP_ID=MMETSP1339-20121228/90648_1 /TAXON_ID=94617 /ORGANISM="Fibrocapsa japonica" /LENGTH=210 /DNA_ID=CAMNT_0000961511 /DNA_START=253 /DNA_END=885 /DNA_ORIENTATION=- /assembly_acc=CAM_ASM_000762